MHEHGLYLAQLIDSAIKAYAAGAVRRQVEQDPAAIEAYGASGFVDLAGDTEVVLTFLAEALAAARPRLLFDQIEWQVVARSARGLALDPLRSNLMCLRDELVASLPEGGGKAPAEYLERAAELVETAPRELPTRLDGEGPVVDLARHYLLAVLEARRADAIDLLHRAQEGGMAIADLHGVITLAQAEVGRMWHMAEAHVGEEHICTEVSRQALAVLRLAMPRAERNGGRVLCTSVGGELHGIGLEIVADHLEMAGWETVMLGASTPVPDLLLAIRDFEPDVVALSASVATQVRSVAKVIAAIRAHADRPDVAVLVGGAPFRAVEDLWQVVGADGTAPAAGDAPTAAATVRP